MWLRRTIALGFWVCLAEVLRSPLHLSDAGNLYLLVPVAIFITISPFAFDSIWLSLIYIITFPAWSPIYLIVYLMRLSKHQRLRARQKLSVFYRSPIATALHSAAAAGLGFAIYHSTSPTLLRVSLGAMLIVTLDMVALTLFMPPSLLTARAILRTLRKYLRGTYMESYIFTEELRIEPWQTMTANLRIGRLFWMAGSLKRIIASLLSSRAVVRSFLLLLFFTFLNVAINFGVIYLAGSKIDKHFLGCSTSTPGIIDSTFFSLTYITTAGGSGLCANSASAKILVSMELVCGLALLSIAGIGFASLHLADLESARDETSDLMHDIRDKLFRASKVVSFGEILSANHRQPKNEDIEMKAKESEREAAQVWIESVLQAAKDLPKEYHDLVEEAQFPDL
jgi:hypothetical protein